VSLTAVDRATGICTFSGTATGVTTNDYIFQAADTFYINGGTITYVSSGANPSAGTFTTWAQFIEALARLAGTATSVGTGAGTIWTGTYYEVADVAAYDAVPFYTYHARIRRLAGTAFTAIPYTFRPSAGVILSNDNNYADVCNSRGNSTGATNDEMVVWSPLYARHAPPVLTPLPNPATGSITAVAGSLLIDTETFVINDGVNAAVTFEFDSNASVVETATLRRVAFTAGDSAATVAATIATAINAATLLVNVSSTVGATVNLVNERPVTTSNIAITDTVADVGFTTVGMTGGGTSPARTAMTTSYPMRVEVATNDHGASCTMESAGVGPTAIFAWRL
jgi:hypothetical protein